MTCSGKLLPAITRLAAALSSSLFLAAACAAVASNRPLLAAGFVLYACATRMTLCGSAKATIPAAAVDRDDVLDYLWTEAKGGPEAVGAR